MEFKTGDIVKILSPEGTIIFRVLLHGCIHILEILAPVVTETETGWVEIETGWPVETETGWPLDWQKITTWR